MSSEKIFYNYSTQSFRKGEKIADHEVVALLTRDARVTYHKERNSKNFHIVKRVVPQNLLE